MLENREKAALANPIAYLRKGAPPYLIVHGDKDPTVPVNQSQLLFEALAVAGIPAHFHTIHGAGHGGPGFAGRDIDQMVKTFFDQVLKRSAPMPAGASKSESDAPSGAGEPGAGARRGIPWEAVLAHDDKNHDGKISREEFGGPPQLFDRLDRDHDGFITREEHEAVMPPSRP